MAKTKTRKVRKTQKKRQMSPVLERLDAGAAAFRRLLMDPCNAPLAGPAYSGLGTGQFRRFRKLYYFPTDAVEAVYGFQFGTNCVTTGGHSAAGAGGNITLVSGAIAAELGTASATEVRCVAGCLKVRYVGKETDRAGSVGLYVGPSLTPVSGATGANADLYLSRCPMITRLGECVHEVKFVPGMGDQRFTPPSQTAFERDKTTVYTVLKGVPAGSVVVEVTYVVELDQTVGGDVVQTAVPPASSTPLNVVLRSMGEVAQWAFTNVLVPTIKAYANPMVSTLATNYTAASRGTRYLTY